MKDRSLLLILVLMVFSSVHGQDPEKKDSSWALGGRAVFTLAQSNFTDWSAGGINSFSGNTRLDLFAKYQKNKLSWENTMIAAYGLANQNDKGLRKTDDIIELNSKLGIQAKKKWYYTVLMDAKTQLAEGRKYADDDSFSVVSGALAPLYFNFAIGVDYKPGKEFSMFVSPINSKNTFVFDEELAPLYSIPENKTFRPDLGAILKFTFEKDLLENLNVQSRLDLFANYLDLDEIDDVDLNWEVLISLKVFKLISVNLNTHLIWDKDVLFANESGGKEPRMQFKEIFGAGLSYSF